MHPAPDNRRGILAMVAAMTLYVVNDTLLKLASAGFAASQIMVVRGVFATAIVLGLVAAMGEGPKLHLALRPRVVLRAVVEATVAFLFILALSRLPLAEATAISQTTPMIITLLAVVLGLESVGWRRWSAIAVGFAGVLLIVKPSAEAFSVYSLLALCSAFLVAVRDLLTRSIGSEVPTLVVTLTATVIVMLSGGVFAIFETWGPFSWEQAGLLFAAAILVTAGNICLIVAFRRGEVAVVAPFRYSIVLSAIVLGVVVFGDWPDALSWAGITLIMGSGVYTMHRENVRRREAARALRKQAP